LGIFGDRFDESLRDAITSRWTFWRISFESAGATWATDRDRTSAPTISQCKLIARSRNVRRSPDAANDPLSAIEMTQAIQEKNKAFVLEAFETLFNKRDYAAAERFWSPNYIQHSAHIPPGREELFALVKGFLKISAARTRSPSPMATTCCSMAGLAT
jgi:hypothetical protein